MIVFLAIVWVVGIIASIVFIVRPNPKIVVYATRGRAVAMLAAVFLGVPILSAIIDGPSKAPLKAEAGKGGGTANAGDKAAPAPAPSAWNVDSEASPLDDSTNVYASVKADNKVKGWLSSETPTLTARCKEGKLDLYVDTNSQITSDIDFNSGQTLARVRYRIGQSPPVTVSAPESSDGEAFFLRAPEKVMRGLKGAEKFVVEYTPFQSGMGVATFDITGSAEAMDKVLAACHRK